MFELQKPQPGTDKNAPSVAFGHAVRSDRVPDGIAHPSPMRPAFSPDAMRHYQRLRIFGR